MNKINNYIKYIAIVLVIFAIPVFFANAQGAPLDASCSADAEYLYYGDNITWTTVVSGGTAPYTIEWDGDDGVDGTGTDVTGSYTSAGFKTMQLTVTDDDGTVFDTVECPGVTVIAPLEWGSCTVDEPNSHIGFEVEWTMSPIGGLPPYSGVWGGTDGLSGTSEEVTITYTSEGIKTATFSNLTSWDSQAIIGTWDCSPDVTVYEVPEPLVATCSVSDTKIRTGDNAEWSADISGGIAPYTVSWTGTDQSGEEGVSINIEYDTPGTKTASAFVSSDDGQSIIGLDCGSTEVTQQTGGGSSNNSGGQDDDDDDSDEDSNDDSTATSTDSTATSTDSTTETTATVFIPVTTGTIASASVSTEGNDEGSNDDSEGSSATSTDISIEDQTFASSTFERLRDANSKFLASLGSINFSNIGSWTWLVLTVLALVVGFLTRFLVLKRRKTGEDDQINL